MIINTGRGAQAAEYSLAPSFLIYLSRTIVADIIKNKVFSYVCPAFRCPNVILAQHIADSKGKKTQRMECFST